MSKSIIRVIGIIAVIVYAMSFNYGGCGGGAGGTTGSSNTPAVDLPPVLNAISDQTVSEGATLTITVSGTDPEGGALTYTTYNMPAGAIFTAATRTFTWTPNYNQAGTYPGVRFRVIDSAYLYDEKIITITATDVAGPNAPSNLSAQAISSSQIELTWTDNSNDEDGFRIERKLGATGVYATLSGTVAANVFTYSDYAAFSNSAYYYRVRSYAAPGNSAYSNEASAAVIPLLTAPTVINNYVTSYNHNSATLYGVVNPNGLATTGYFQWGTTASYGNTAAIPSLGNGTSSIGATADISGLSPSATYHFRVVVTNSAGTSNGADATLTTTPEPVLPTAVTTPAINITYNSVSLTGSANPNGFAATAYFQWGATTEYGNSTVPQAIGSVTTSLNVTADFTGIFSNTTYHYRTVASNDSGKAYGADQEFTTPPGPPTVMTNPATNIDFNNAVLNGTVNPNGQATTGYFQWGTTTSYGNTTTTQSFGGGTGFVNAAANLAGLTANTTYHLRLVASNSSSTAYGVDQSFTAVTSVKWTSIMGGADHTAGIKNNGTLWVWGDNTQGELGLSNYISQTTPTQVGTDTTWIKVAVGANYTLAIKSPDLLYAWGANGYGQLGDGTYAAKNTPTLIGTGWSAIAAGDSHTIGLKTDGSLYAWGANGYGQLGDGTTTAKNTPTLISTTGWSVIAAGDSHTIGLKTDGALYAWGANGSGQLGDGTTTAKNTPTLISTTSWSKVDCGNSHTVALKTNGTVWTWGDNAFGQLCLGDVLSRTTPAAITETGWSDISVGSNHTIGKKSAGTAWTCGANSSGQLGLGDSVNRTALSMVVTDTDWSVVSAGWNYSVGAKQNDALLAWGSNSSGQLGLGDTYDRNRPGNPSAGWIVSAGGSHSVGRKANGTIWVWGSNSSGQLGLGDSSNRFSPVQVGADTNWKQSACGSSHTIAIKTDGSLWAWGNNYYGQLGLGDISYRYVPVRVGTGTNWSAISVGYYNTIALKTDGSLWAWGSNSSGQLGDGTYTTRYTPTRIGTDTNWSAIAASAGYSGWWSDTGGYTIALKTDGSLWAWGNNNYGQFGDGTAYTNRNTPTRIGTDTNWSAIGVGSFHTIALKTDGSLWAWGRNYEGQLGLGDTSNRYVPVRVGTDANWSAIGAGYADTVALKTDGSLWAWGSNSSGQLGLGDFSNRYVPIRIGTENNWSAIAAGYYHTIALKTDGFLWAWGYNSSGQLGDGTYTNRYIPTRVLGQ